MSQLAVRDQIDQHKLQALADVANEAHRAAQSSYHQALSHALGAGRALNEAKQQVPFGEWLPWLARNVEFSERTAQVYMQLASARELPDAQRAADLSIRSVLSQVAKPKPRSSADVIDTLRDVVQQQPDDPSYRDARKTVEVGWNDAQRTRADRALEHLDASRDAITEARQPGLSPYAASELARDAAKRARQAASVLDELAFSF